jgi:hypothetical protein
VVHATGGDFTKNLAMIAPVMKSRSFEEESEWRLVSEGGINASSLEFRPGFSNLAPHFSLVLGAKDAYLNSITVGPTPSPDLAIDAAKMLVAKYGVSQTTEMFGTDIPFRNW